MIKKVKDSTKKLYKNLTIADIEKALDVFYSKTKSRVSGDVTVTDYSDTHVEVSNGSFHGIIPKEMWLKALQEALGDTKKTTE
jgi:hypothetical protein